MSRQGRVENLKPQNLRTKEEQKEIARKGGIASGIARKEKKTLQETAKYILSCSLNTEGKKRLESMGISIDEDNPTTMTALVMGQVVSAINGSQKSAEWVQSLIEERKEEEATAQSFIDALNGYKGVSDGIIEE